MKSGEPFSMQPKQYLKMILKYGWLKMTGKMPKHSRPVDTKTFTADPHATETLGLLRYKVIDCFEGSESEIKESAPKLCQTYVLWIIAEDDSINQACNVALDSEWDLELAYRLSRFRNGFAVNAKRRGMQDFTWEWFCVQPDDIAIKLQENGKLHVKAFPNGDGEDVVEIEFLTDVSIRTSSFLHLSLNPENTQRPERRVVILQGSRIRFPLVIDEKVQLVSQS